MEIIASYKQLKVKSTSFKAGEVIHNMVAKPELVETLCKKFLRKSGNGYVIKSTYAADRETHCRNMCYLEEILRDWAEQTGAKVEHLRVDGYPVNITHYYKVTDPLMSLLEEAGLK